MLLKDRKLLFLLLPLAVIFIAGCSDPSTAHLSSAETDQNADIIGGQLARRGMDQAYLAVGFLRLYRDISYKVLDHTAHELSTQSCSSVLIAPDMLLTAAHCVIDPQFVHMLSDGQASLGGKVYFPQTKQSFKVKKAVFHRGFANVESFDSNGEPVAEAQNDIAIILLEKPTAAPLLPATLVEGTFPEIDQVETRMYGYGISDPKLVDEMMTDGNLRFVDMQGVYSASNNKIHYNQIDGAGVCYGDSGGPQFLRSESSKELFLIGISSSLRQKKGHSDNPCLQRSEATALPDYMEWLKGARQRIRQSGEYNSVQPH